MRTFTVTVIGPRRDQSDVKSPAKFTRTVTIRAWNALDAAIIAASQ